METIEELLNEALNSERKAKEFYLSAASKARSSAGKQFFQELAEFEQNHYDRVQHVITAKLNNQNITAQHTQANTPAYRSEIKGEIEPNKDEIVSVINLAIEAEKEAQERYRTIATKLTNETEKSIFQELANEERNHQKILEDQFYHISNTGTIIWE